MRDLAGDAGQGIVIHDEHRQRALSSKLGNPRMIRSQRQTRTPPGYAGPVVAATLDALLAMPPRAAIRAPPPRIFGISGLPGCGKTTFAHQLATAAGARGMRSLVVSLDDFYLGRRERRCLAREVHPLLATRGVPGTHDVDRLERVLDTLGRASRREPVALPRFDKGRDTRAAPSRWCLVTQAPDLVLLEGWCVGAVPQAAAALRRACNRLERDEDPDRIWRSWVNARLAEADARLWRRLDRLVLLEAPAFAVVAHWRDEQERVLRARKAPRAMSAAALRRFLMHYERIGRHALRELPARADLRIRLDGNRGVRQIVIA